METIKNTIYFESNNEFEDFCFAPYSIIEQDGVPTIKGVYKCEPIFILYATGILDIQVQTYPKKRDHYKNRFACLPRQVAGCLLGER